MNDMAKANKPPANAPTEDAEVNDPVATESNVEQLRAELDAAKAENVQLRTQLDTAKAETSARDAGYQTRIGQLESEIERLRDRLTEAAAPAPVPPVVSGTRRARVSVPGTHVAPIEVTIPRDTRDHTTAAIEAAKSATGIVAFGAGPQVEFLDD